MENNIDQSEKIAESIVDIMQQNESKDENKFKEWYKTNRHASKVVTKLTDGAKLKKEVLSFHREEKFLLANDLVNKIEKRERRRGIIRVSSIAAALIAISFMIYTTTQKPVENQNVITSQREKREEQPQEPIVITQGGVKIDLLGMRDENKMNHKNNLEINNISEIVNDESAQEDGINNFNRMIVPKQYTTKLTLDDGSVVHLNANSELKFPTKFVGKNRRVELKGEAFFEVAKSDKQFIVTIDGMDIKVYGTKFNVRSRGEGVLETVLVSGSIGVTANGMNEVMMKPNQRLEIDCATQKYKLDSVNCQHFLGWINGLFFFTNASMCEVVEELESWYGVEINYSEGDFDHLSINFSINRENEFGDIILFMEKITNVKFVKERSNVYSLKK